MKNILVFPADPIRAALSDPDWLTEQAVRVDELAQQASIFSSKNLKLAIHPKSEDEAIIASKAYIALLQNGRDPSKSEILGLILAEAEPLFQNLLAWFRWNSHHQAPWNSLFERPDGITRAVLEQYSTEGLLLGLRFGNEEQQQPHQRGIKTAAILHHNQPSEEEASKRVTAACRASRELAVRVTARRQQRQVMLWNSEPYEEFLWCAALGAYANRIEITSHLQTET